MQKIVIALGAFTVEVSEENQKDLIRQAAFWSEIPKSCPLCNADLRFSYRSPQDNQYWGMQCLGPVTHEVNFGVYKDANLGLYYKDEWHEEFGGRQQNDQYSGGQQSQHTSTPPQSSDTGSPVATHLGDMITVKHLGMIRAIAREKNTDLEAVCSEMFSCLVDQLSKRAASDLINHLQGIQSGGQPAPSMRTAVEGAGAPPPPAPARLPTNDDIPF
jgi:hypothetical protein